MGETPNIAIKRSVNYRKSMKTEGLFYRQNS